MGKRKFQDYISDECHRRYSCVHCRAHLANHDELISKVSKHINLTVFFSVIHLDFLSAVHSHFKEAKGKHTSSIKCKFSRSTYRYQARALDFVVRCLLVFIQREYWLWKGRGANSPNGTSCSC